MAALFVLLAAAFALAGAVTNTFRPGYRYTVGDHPDGAMRPPNYCLRLDNLHRATAAGAFSSVNTRRFTFSCLDVVAEVGTDQCGPYTLAGTVRGGLDTGTVHAPLGNWTVHFTVPASHIDLCDPNNGRMRARTASTATLLVGFIEAVETVGCSTTPADVCFPAGTRIELRGKRASGNVYHEVKRNHRGVAGTSGFGWLEVNAGGTAQPPVWTTFGGGGSLDWLYTLHEQGPRCGQGCLAGTVVTTALAPPNGVRYTFSQPPQTCAVSHFVVNMPPCVQLDDLTVRCASAPGQPLLPTSALDLGAYGPCGAINFGAAIARPFKVDLPANCRDVIVAVADTQLATAAAGVQPIGLKGATQCSLCEADHGFVGDVGGLGDTCVPACGCQPPLECRCSNVTGTEEQACGVLTDGTLQYTCQECRPARVGQVCQLGCSCEPGAVCSAAYAVELGYAAGTLVCTPDHCLNGQADPVLGELGIDCGGPCGIDCGCTQQNATGGVCEERCGCAGGDVCAFGLAAQFNLTGGERVCVPPHCVNGVQDGDETGPDCGGACGRCLCPLRGVGELCDRTLDIGLDCADGELAFPAAAAADTALASTFGFSGGPPPATCSNGCACAPPLVCSKKRARQYGFPRNAFVCTPPHCLNGRRDRALNETARDCGGACGDCLPRWFPDKCWKKPVKQPKGRSKSGATLTTLTDFESQPLRLIFSPSEMASMNRTETTSALERAAVGVGIAAAFLLCITAALCVGCACTALRPRSRPDIASDSSESDSSGSDGDDNRLVDGGSRQLTTSLSRRRQLYPMSEDD